MRNLSTWLLAMFMVMFTGFRVIVTITNQQGSPIGGIAIQNITIEIVLIFLTLLCLILIVKRKVLGAIIYVLAYGWYFGTDLYNIITSVLVDEAKLGMSGSLSLLSSGIGVLLPLMVLLDILADKGRKAHPVDKKTDWFYKNEQYDRKLDDRADKNNYRTL